MVILAPKTIRQSRLLGGASLAALSLAVSFLPAPARAQSQPFGSLIAMQAGRTTLPNGQVSQWSGAKTPVIGVSTDGRPQMTIEQTKSKALLDWEKFQLQTNEVLEFQQQSADWIAVNRVHGNQASQINGEIRAKGRVFVLDDNGVLMGKDAKINVRQLVTGRGVSDVNVDGNTTTIIQSKDKAILNWSNMSLQAGEVLKFQQEKKDWIALNRSLATGTTKIDGTIKADGHLYLIAREGLAINGSVNAQQVIASALDIRDSQFLTNGLVSIGDQNSYRTNPTFSNSWIYGTDVVDGFLQLDDPAPLYFDPNDPTRYIVTIGNKGSITTGDRGKVMLFGPNVVNRGTITVRNEGQVILAAGDNIYLANGANGRVNAFIGAYNPMASARINIPYFGMPPVVTNEEYQQLFLTITGTKYEIGHVFTFEEMTAIIGGRGGLPGQLVKYVNDLQNKRAAEVGFHARNEGIIAGIGGGSVDFRGMNLEQMGGITLTSTALFRASINFQAYAYDYQEYAGDQINGPYVPGHGTVVFGKGSLTQITPDLDSKDMIPVTSGRQSVGTLKINAGAVHMQDDSMIYMPSGTMNVLLDSGQHVFDNNRGEGANPDNEDGTRFLMEKGATIDLSGWKSTVLPMGYHQVTGKLFAAQLADSPMQRDGVLYRKEISVDRRYGTNVAGWQSLDNLNQGTLAQFLIDGGTLNMDIGDDFIMKSGSVIDVSGGKTIYQDGFVYTTLLRRLDGTIIDIREASPDELYMGLANQWTQYDTKWGRQRDYYIPLMSSVQGKFETSYEEGGKGGSINILAPDSVLQGSMLGGTTVGRYQHANLPKGGVLRLNDAGNAEGEYVSNNILIQAQERALGAGFGLKDKLSDTYDALFGVEFDPATDRPGGSSGARQDNSTLASADFFNRSTMGSYYLRQSGRMDSPETAVTVEKGANLVLQHGGSLEIDASQRVKFLGSVRTEGGNVTLGGMTMEFDAATRLDTRGSWYSDFEVESPLALTAEPRINGGKVTLFASGRGFDGAPPVDGVDLSDLKFVMPDTMVIDTSGGAWADRNGNISLGKGGDISISAGMGTQDKLDLGALASARAYGLGGNGKFSLELADAIVIGGAPSAASGTGRGPFRIAASFFENSGFSGISLKAPTITMVEGVRINATSASLQFKDAGLLNGKPPAVFAPSGTDIFALAEARYVPIGQRPAALRRGMDIGFEGVTTIGAGSVLSTEAGGTIKMIGDVIDVRGTLDAPGGAITLGGGQGTVNIAATAKLFARGTSYVTRMGVSSSGQGLTDGVILNGGTISLNADNVRLSEGALLDVSGTTVRFDLPVTDANGGVIRGPVTLASNGGTISIAGETLSIDDATYLATAGGAGARGGTFNIDWGGTYGGGGSNYPAPSAAYGYIGYLFEGGYFTDKQGNPVTSFYGTDLSNIDFSGWGSFDFAPGFTVANAEELISILTNYNAGALGAPPVFMIGKNLPPVTAAPPAAPQIDSGLFHLLKDLGGFQFMPVNTSTPAQTRLSTAKIEQGGFSRFGLSASPGVMFVGDVAIGGKRADGSYVFDRIDIKSDRIFGQVGANVKLDAGIVTLGSSTGRTGTVDQAAYDIALQGIGVAPVNANTHIAISAGTLLQVENANFYGYSDTSLTSGGDIRLAGFSVTALEHPIGQLITGGNLTLKADQVYAGTGVKFAIKAGDTLTILPQDAGNAINASPYEAAAELTLTAPRIVQGGILRSPLGTLNLVATNDGSAGAGTIRLLAGSLTSVSADGRLIPYGYTSNGDTWLDPYSGLELVTLPTKTVTLTGDVVDMQTGSTLDVSGGGNLYAREFVPGIGGTKDWLTGYRDANFQWVSAPGEIFAVMPSFEGDIAPLGTTPGNGPGIGDKVYLSGGSGLKAGYYTLLPAEYALLPGAFRVTAKHGGTGFEDMQLGQFANQTDGSSIQAGYVLHGGMSGARDQRNTGFLVMPGATLRLRSGYNESLADTFFTSPAFLKKALRVNRPVGDVPRIPLDGGSVVFRAGKTLNLGATLKSAAGKGGRGGFADIDSSRIVVAGAGTDTSGYSGYLILDSDKLNAFGAESLLIGGTRRQGAANLELVVSGTDIVVDNKGSKLVGPELIFASSDAIRVKDGSTIETRGAITGNSGDLRIVPGIAKLIDPGKPWTTEDDVLVHGVLDQGSVLRLSSGAQIDILRDPKAVDEMAALRADPVKLAAVNAKRAQFGLAPLRPSGVLDIADGATLKSSGAIAFDATQDTTLGAGATIDAKQISAASSRVSLGAVPIGTGGLVFAGGSIGALGRASEITLKSYSSIDIYGDTALSATDALRLDARTFRIIDGSGETTLSGRSITLANSNGGTAEAVAGAGKLTINADNVYFEGGSKWLSGIDRLTVNAAQRIVGRGDGTVFVPGALDLTSGGLVADSGSRLFFDAIGAVNIASNANVLPVYSTFGATLGITGASVTHAGQIRLTGGTVNLRARSGDVVLAAGSTIDVTSDAVKLFDKSVGVGAGTVGLTADMGDINLIAGSKVDVSGSRAGGDAGTFTAAAGLGEVRLGGTILGKAAAGSRSGSFGLVTRSLSDFAALNAILDTGGFLQSRRFEINQGDLDITGTVNVQEFAAITNNGSITVNGTVRTVGDNGGSIRLSAAEDVIVGPTGQLLARANAAAGSGGSVVVETAGRNGGEIDLLAGSLIDVSGTGPGGRVVRLRAPQRGNDLAIGTIGGTITGARSVIAEAYRVYDGIGTIDQGVIDRVSTDAGLFMQNAAAINARLGGLARVAAGIELRSDGDMELTKDWNLHDLRFDGSAGVLTLRAKGDLLINANLSDGFVDTSTTAALDGNASWSINLTAGANLVSPDSLAVLATGQLAAGKGSVIIGGKADTIEYFYDPAHGNENRLYRTDSQGRFLRDPNQSNYHTGFLELDRDPVTGAYLDPLSGKPIPKDPVTGDYVDTGYYARRPMPWVFYSWGGGYESEEQDGTLSYSGNPLARAKYTQRDNSTGYMVRTGTGGINVSSGRDLILKERASVIYTAGENAAPVAGFYAPAGATYSVNGGDISVRAAGNIIASPTPQTPAGWLRQRFRLNPTTSLFEQTADGYAQTSWWVDFGAFQGGIGALGGGDVAIDAGGDISNLGVAIPTSGRLPGNTVNGEPVGTLVTTGGGNLRMRAGGNIKGGVYYVGDGTGDITAGGAFLSGGTARVIDRSAPGIGCGSSEDCYIHTGPDTKIDYATYALLYTSSGQFKLQSGGDLNIDAVMDPLIGRAYINNGESDQNAAAFQSYTPDASVSLFSAGGNVTMWNNAYNIDILTKRSGLQPNYFIGNNETPESGLSTIGYELRPATVTAVAAAGDVSSLGQMMLAPAARGNLELLAAGNVYIGYGTTAINPMLADSAQDNPNYRSGGQGIIMSQALERLLRTASNPSNAGYGNVERVHYLVAGRGLNYPGWQLFTQTIVPDLHLGDATPVRIYAGRGDVVTSTQAGITLPKAMWVQAGGNVYFPSYTIQHNNRTDLSLVRTGKGLYFDTNYGINDNATQSILNRGHITLSGPGRLEIEAGTEFYMPSNELGITSSRIGVYSDSTPSNQVPAPPSAWKPDEAAADIAISTGFNQTPSYKAFEDAYLNPETTGKIADYLLDDGALGKKLPTYLFDREYPRAAGAEGEFATPEGREGLVNYVRRLQGLDPLKTKAEQYAYLDTAWSYWSTLATDFKTPFYRDIFFLELRTTGREANDPKSDRLGTTFRGYNAIATLFPGAEKKADQALAAGDSRWIGDYETYAGRVMSFGGGKVEIVSPGGAIKLSNPAATADQNGQPSEASPRGNALRSGIVTTDGGAINLFAHNSVTLNESRTLTTKGGNIMIWSSYGDIAAGKGAKTSISPQFYNYTLSQWAAMEREPAGLPTGAGIGTLATQQGSPPADVDLIAPNGIVDAGDAGIRVSGNFNVFAVQILGTDNIDVAGVKTGLPITPAAPPTSLDTGELSAKSNDVIAAITKATAKVRENNMNQTPSLIEVRVTGYGEACDPATRDCPRGDTTVSSAAPPAPAVPPIKVAELRQVAQEMPFDIGEQDIRSAVRAVGRASGYSILYDDAALAQGQAPAVRGKMTPEQALSRLLARHGITAMRTGPKTIILRRTRSS
ncbi:filamentous haemagglutinin family protein [Sphingomonas alpina]|uniref:Filamentous hemagglutinin family protein n=1 Tax=Sphingomonas alpina TaxID=653931 RepID=A0A7H0LFV7_9SPHN|nr:filamentous haemagglutinin family protein [Sphingomonas alpina]QNQ08560.1 filamentous hemagglutinin family protein [Sphingomonas alpina]